MQTVNVEKLNPAVVDAATKALIEEAQAAARRGQICTTEEVETDLDKVHQEWLESQKTLLPA